MFGVTAEPAARPVALTQRARPAATALSASPSGEARREGQGRVGAADQKPHVGHRHSSASAPPGSAVAASRARSRRARLTPRRSARTRPRPARPRRRWPGSGCCRQGCACAGWPRPAPSCGGAVSQPPVTLTAARAAAHPGRTRARPGGPPGRRPGPRSCRPGYLSSPQPARQARAHRARWGRVARSGQKEPGHPG